LIKIKIAFSHNKYITGNDKNCHPGNTLSIDLLLALSIDISQVNSSLKT